jgi:hypothetical protein
VNSPFSGAYFIVYSIGHDQALLNPVAFKVEDWDLKPVVSALFETAGANWNDHVSNSSSDAELLDATDETCAAGELDICVHGGEHRAVALSGVDSCNGMSFSDSLGVFDWSCVVEAKGVKIYSTGFKADKTLNSLIGSSGSGHDWIPNQLTISSAIGTLSTPLTKWWANTVTTIDAASTVSNQLTSEGDVYVIASPLTTNGISIEADKISLLIKANVSYASAGNNCNTATAESTSADFECGIFSGSQKFLWYEQMPGTTISTSSAWGVFVYSVFHSKFINLSLSDGILGLYLRYSKVNEFISGTIVDSTSYGLYRS